MTALREYEIEVTLALDEPQTPISDPPPDDDEEAQERYWDTFRLSRLGGVLMDLLEDGSHIIRSDDCFGEFHFPIEAPNKAAAAAVAATLVAHATAALNVEPALVSIVVANDRDDLRTFHEIQADGD
jgi:hypothetical protein